VRLERDDGRGGWYNAPAAVRRLRLTLCFMKAPLPAAIGRYQVREKLAEGGMGVLYLAVDPIIDRLVALKLLRVSNDEELSDRFAREARAAGRLLHPNIITIFDVGDHDGQPFIAMEYVTGETLGEIVRRKAPLPLARRVGMIADLCDGLAFAHRSGIVHRDIKPANIMVTRDGILKILDFGIAHLADSRMTQTGAFMGTPAYMSPEQISGNLIDHRSDIFAVGCVLYELLAYKQAFEGDSPIRITHKILNEDPASLLTISPPLDRALVQIVERAIQKEPNHRYPDLSVMRSELLRAIDRANSAGETLVIDPRRSVSTPPEAPAGSQSPDRRSHARRRAAQVEAHLSAAREALAAERYDDAISASDEAAVLDPDDNRAHDLMAQARAAVQKQQARAWLEQARDAVKRGALTDAANLLAQTLTTMPGDSQAIALQRELRSLQRDRELLAERKRLLQRALEHARSSLAERALDSAIRSANEVLAQDPENAEAGAIKDEAFEILAEERQKAEHDRRAREAVSAARGTFDGGRHGRAIADLERFEPPHELVDALLGDLRREASAIQAREREEARRIAEARAEEAARAAEARAAEDARRAADANAAAEAERATQARLAAEARDRARLAAEAAEEEERREHARADTMADPGATWHRVSRPPGQPDSSTAADVLTEVPSPALRRGIPLERDVARRPLTKSIAVATALAGLGVVSLVWLFRADSTPAPQAAKTTTTEVSAQPPSSQAIAPGPGLPVTINAVPWATVRILRQDSAVAADGITPLVVELPEGDYTLELRNDLFTPVTRPLAVRAGVPVVVDVKLPGADVEKILDDVLGPAQ
jgi:serine/threonine protein kinase